MAPAATPLSSLLIRLQVLESGQDSEPGRMVDELHASWHSHSKLADSRTLMQAFSTTFADDEAAVNGHTNASHIKAPMEKVKEFCADVLPDFGKIKGPPGSAVELLQKAIGSRGHDFTKSPTLKFLFLQGCVYITLGTLFMLLPWLTSLLLLIWVDENEAGAVRLFGLAVIVVGYFYCQAARSCPLNAIENLVAETSFDRCTFVLFFTLVFGLFGYCRLMMCLAFALMDPAMAALTMYRWEQEKDPAPAAAAPSDSEPKAD